MEPMDFMEPAMEVHPGAGPDMEPAAKEREAAFTRAASEISAVSGRAQI